MYVFDLDGTLADASHRLHYISQTDALVKHGYLPDDWKKNWPAFFEACRDDAVIEPIAKVARLMLANAYPIAYVTGRSEQYIAHTVEWLWKNYLWYRPQTTIFMRKIGDKRPDEVVKPELIKQLPYPVTAIFEDRTRVVQKWRELGYTCLQVNDGNY